VADNKYLHCGKCWYVLGRIPSGDPTIFDTFDCSWTCLKCNRLNLSSDGLTEIRDSAKDIHFFYSRTDEENDRIDEMRQLFEFNREDFSPSKF
jgi:hypothetical protein